MNHCHFSILYNELPFLKQKVPFLYENFDQLIFYDLNTFNDPYKFSNDGSHEFIKEYPDPENKITLIETKNLSKVNPLGKSNIIKRKMFSLGSEYIDPNMNFYWCTDMDEFFNSNLIKEVEEIYNRNPDIQSIEVDHFIFWKDLDILICRDLKKLSEPFFSRIAIHHDGNKYGHCDIKTRYSKSKKAKENIYHFAFVGETRTTDKLFKYYSGTGPLYRSIWESDKRPYLEKGKIYGFPFMHPNPSRKRGITPYPGNIQKELPYISFEELAEDLNCEFKPSQFK